MLKLTPVLALALSAQPPQEGDILIFSSGELTAKPVFVKTTTLSNYTHCGIVVRDRAGNLKLLEANK